MSSFVKSSVASFIPSASASGINEKPRISAAIPSASAQKYSSVKKWNQSARVRGNEIKMSIDDTNLPKKNPKISIKKNPRFDPKKNPSLDLKKNPSFDIKRNPRL